MRFVWWPSEIRRLKAAVEYMRAGRDKWQESFLQENRQVAFVRAQWERESAKATRLQNEVEHLKEQAVQQKQERRAIYEQRDELRRLIKILCRNDPQIVPEWVHRPCDANGNQVRPSEANGG